MPRPFKLRRIAQCPEARSFKPSGVPMRMLREVYLPLDGLEAMRLCDLEGLGQEEAAVRMGVSRQTLGRLLAVARRNVTAALVEGMALRIEDEDHHRVAAPDPEADETAASAPEGANLRNSERKVMKIAVSTVGTTLDSPVDPHFGRAAGFLVVDPETLDAEHVPNTGFNGLSHGAGIATAELVALTGAGIVLTGSIGPKAYRALHAAGMQVGHKVDGMTVREAVEAYRRGEVEMALQPSSAGHAG